MSDHGDSDTPDYDAVTIPEGKPREEIRTSSGGRTSSTASNSEGTRRR